MAKPKINKRPLKRVTGDLDADLLLHHYHAAKRLVKEKKQTAWKLAAAVALSRRLVIGDGRCFKPPG